MPARELDDEREDDCEDDRETGGRVGGVWPRPARATT